MKKNILKKICSLSLKNIVVVLGFFVFSIIIVAYGADQWIWWYRAKAGITTVRTYTWSSSYNSNMIEEYGICKTIANNTCSNDVFIPTHTSPEWAAFIANPPACITLGECGCVLEQFINGVYDWTIQNSKIRNAVAGYSNVDLVINWTYGPFVAGYGIQIGIVVSQNLFDNRQMIASTDVIAVSTTITNNPLHEFELYGITTGTKDINRWCFDDGSYWVNSNVYSEQTLLANETMYSPVFTGGSLRFGGYSWADFGLTYNIYGSSNSNQYKFNRFFGCRSELLPNPDKYCVERIIRKDGAPENKPTTIYLKEFTNNHQFVEWWCGSWDACLPYDNTICSNLTQLASGADFRAMIDADISATGTGWLYDMIKPYWSDEMNHLLGWTPSNEYFYYRNTTGSNPWSEYSTQMFGFYIKWDLWSYTYIKQSTASYLSYMSDNNYYYYHSDEFPWWISAERYHGSTMWVNVSRDYNNNDKYVYIPLSGNNYLAFQVRYMDAIPQGYDDTYWMIDDWTYFWWWGGLAKYICISHTCGVWYNKTLTWCVSDGSLPF